MNIFLLLLHYILKKILSWEHPHRPHQSGFWDPQGWASGLGSEDWCKAQLHLTHMQGLSVMPPRGCRLQVVSKVLKCSGKQFIALQQCLSRQQHSGGPPGNSSVSWGQVHVLGDLWKACQQFFLRAVSPGTKVSCFHRGKRLEEHLYLPPLCLRHLICRVCTEGAAVQKAYSYSLVQNPLTSWVQTHWQRWAWSGQEASPMAISFPCLKVPWTQHVRGPPSPDSQPWAFESVSEREALILLVHPNSDTYRVIIQTMRSHRDQTCRDTKTWRQGPIRTTTAAQPHNGTQRHSDTRRALPFSLYFLLVYIG